MADAAANIRTRRSRRLRNSSEVIVRVPLTAMWKGLEVTGGGADFLDCGAFLHHKA